ncbi:PspC domain-containing protein [Parapedobacter sp. 10938]|uniref:PspC domain-containing protein n=1 Tax=Parapedobacter flavus TaxID=3110225 RepID=UPI002DB9291C|nr:PspC domain-containing protein [Parapedobacter sp. 10938]MEC3881078.1 PspC domain-containing protein [Parapedobacter sp. 10938]
MEKKLQRIPHEGAVAGVCAGLGTYFGIDKTWVRVAFVISVFFSGYMGIGLLGPIVYIVLWIVLPIKSFVLPSDPFRVDYRVQPNPPVEDFGGYPPHAGDQRHQFNRANKKVSKDRYVAGLILVALGVFFLLHQLDIFYWRDFARFWPVLIILLGVATIFGAFKPQKPKPFSVNEPEEQAPEAQAPQDKPDEPTDNAGTDHGYTK